MIDMRSGKLKERIVIQSATESADASGQPIRTWTNYKTNVPAEHVYVSGGEVYRGRQLSAQSAHLFKVRTLSGVTNQMRVVWDGTNYGIVNVTLPFERSNREQWLECRAAD